MGYLITVKSREDLAVEICMLERERNILERNMFFSTSFTELDTCTGRLGQIRFLLKDLRKQLEKYQLADRVAERLIGNG